MLVLTTVSDLKRQDALGPITQADLLNTPVSYF